MRNFATPVNYINYRRRRTRRRIYQNLARNTLGKNVIHKARQARDISEYIRNPIQKYRKCRRAKAVRRHEYFKKVQGGGTRDKTKRKHIC